MTTLEELIVSGGELDRELIASVLSGFVRLDGDSHTVRFLPAWDQLKNDDKVLVYLLARKGTFGLGWSEDEAISPGEVVHDTGLPGGSVRPGLGRLVAKRLVVTTEGRRYQVPNWAVNQIKTLLSGEAPNR